MENYAKLELIRHQLLDQDGNVSTAKETSGLVELVTGLLNVYSSDRYTDAEKEMSVDIFYRLINNMPISPLTGEDSEWVSIGDDEAPLWKNIRCSTVFKDQECAWDTDVYFNWSWTADPAFNDGKPFKMYFIDPNQRVKIKFPYVKELPNKVFVPTEAFPEEYI